MNSRRFPSPRKPLWKLRFTTQTPSLTLARPKIRLARIEPTKPAGANIVVRVLRTFRTSLSDIYDFLFFGIREDGSSAHVAVASFHELYPPSHSPVTPPNCFPRIQEPQITKNETGDTASNHRQSAGTDPSPKTQPHAQKEKHTSSQPVRFREGRSTDDDIHQLVEKMQDAKNKKLHTMVISLDIQGAFDHLQYNSIRNSLDEINLPSHTIETLKDILTDRKVTIQTAQGPRPTGAKLKATAQAALTKFQHWTDKHQLKVSSEKSTTILISRLVSGSRVKWDNQIIKRSTSLIYLGVIIDNKLNWADHLINMKTKLTHLHQKITRIAGTNWGLNKDLRRRLYKTVAERLILQGAAAWAYPLSARQSRVLNSIQRKFLLNITRAYSTTPTAPLQVIEGIIPLHIKAEQEAVYARTARLRKTSNYNNINFNPNNYEDGITSIKFHPAIFQLEDRISLKSYSFQYPVSIFRRTAQR
ncbi:hypothetical protein AVEN_80806-1 [Araneus ventricosus]|uniref:Uncharacterized protein n=1 Tax=Araneus ventricosus TaxID=182803 RepID=A0A4Y2FGW5_ARAVE|nr:hypothetical protein AVEN_80806-1 [Araneus ventricosus]